MERNSKLSCCWPHFDLVFWKMTLLWGQERMILGKWEVWEWWEIYYKLHWFCIYSFILVVGIFQFRPILNALSCFVRNNWYKPLFPIWSWSHASSILIIRFSLLQSNILVTFFHYDYVGWVIQNNILEYRRMEYRLRYAIIKQNKIRDWRKGLLDESNYNKESK